MAIPALTVEALGSVEEFDRQQAEWDELVARGCATPCLTGAWLRAWWRAFGDDGTSLLLARDSSRRLAGGLLVQASHERLTGIRVRQLAFAANPHSFRMDFVAPADPLREEVLLALVRGLLAAPHAPDALSFRDIARSSATIQTLERVAARCGLAAEAEWRRHSPYVRLQGTWQDYLATRSKSFRSFLRRACRRATESGVSFEAHADGAPHAELLEQGLRLEASGWKGEVSRAILNRGPVAAFYRELVARLAAAGAVRQYLLRLEGEPIAWDLCVVHEGVCYALKTAYDEQQASLSPGFVLQALSLESLLHEGRVRVYDMLPPLSTFKQRWTEESEEQVHVRLYAPTPRGRLARLAHATLRPGLRRVQLLRRAKGLVASWLEPRLGRRR